MKWLWNTLNTWLFSPPHTFESVLRTTDILLQTSDPDYSEHRMSISQSPALQPPQAVEGTPNPPPPDPPSR